MLCNVYGVFGWCWRLRATNVFNFAANVSEQTWGVGKVKTKSKNKTKMHKCMRGLTRLSGRLSDQNYFRL